MKPNPPIYRKLRFGIRTFLLFVTVSAVGFAFLGAEFHRLQKQRRAIDRIQELGGYVRFSFGKNSIGNYSSSSDPSEAGIFRNIFGEDAFSHAEVVSFWGDDASDEELKVLRELPALKQVTFHESQVTDAGLRHVASLPNLESLCLEGETRVTGRGIAMLRDSSRLRHLEIGGSRPIGAPGALELPHYHAQDEILDFIGQLSQLEHLDISNNSITSKGIRRLRGLIHLKHLNLGHLPDITDDALHVLKDMPDLETLVLDSTPITNTGMVHIRRLTQLKSLHLSDTGVSDEGILPLGQLSSIELLSIEGTKVGDVGVATIGDIGSLRSLFLRRTNVTDAGVSRLGKLTNLAYVELPATVSSQAIADLQAMLPQCKIWRSAK